MAKPKTILLWNRDNLIGSALERLLSARQDTTIVRVMDEVDLDAVLAMVDQLNPDIVVLNRDDISFDPHLPLLLIHDRPAIKVFTIGLEDNYMEIYDRHLIRIREQADLLSAMET